MDIELTTAHRFEGAELTPLVFHGRPAFLVQDVERALGYEPGSVRKRLHEEWDAEFEEGEDFAKLVGGELATLKSILPAVDPRSSHLTLLYESGFNLVCIKTEKPAGLRLRRFLAREVLPALRRTGHYSTSADADPDLARAAQLRDIAAMMSPGRHRENVLRAAADQLAAAPAVRRRVVQPASTGPAEAPNRRLRAARDPREDTARELLAKRHTITAPQLLELLGVPEAEMDWAACQRAGELLRVIGWRPRGPARPRVYRPAGVDDMPAVVSAPETDAWLERLRAWTENKRETSTHEALHELGEQNTKATQMRVGSILRSLGFTKKLRRRSDGKRWSYVRP